MKRFLAQVAMRMAGVWGGLCFALAASAQPVVIETVPIGNPGNAGETQGTNVFGAVAYDYQIGKFEVTAGQYTAFLNAMAATDTYRLYNTAMDYDSDPTENGCNITRQGESGSYTYSVAPDWASRPVNFVSWADAARFANWLHNGQPSGAQDLTTTEDGSYFFNGTGEGNVGALEDITREPDATWVIPSEDEWYKAAYHKNDGATASYWNYPTQADGAMSNAIVDPDPGNRATYSNPIGAPYHRTEVGEHENSASAYGTFDQGGNVQEFNEAVPDPPDTRGIRGGSWFWGLTQLAASERPIDMHSDDQEPDIGFRVALVPEPAATPLLVSGVAGLWLLRNCRRGG